jgi:hypothetical protein
MAELEWDASHNRVLVRGLRDADAVEAYAEKFKRLVMDRQINGVSRMTNLSTDDKTLLEIQVKPGVNAQTVLDEIAKHLPTD